MKNSLLKLQVSMVVDQNTEHPILVELLGELFNDISVYFQAIGATNFEQIKNRTDITSRINADTTDIAAVYLRKLKNKLPGVIDHTAEANLKIENCEVRILQADPANRPTFKFLLTLITETLTCIDSIGNNLLLVTGDKSQQLMNHEKVDTFLLPLQTEFSIKEFQRIPIAR